MASSKMYKPVRGLVALLLLWTITLGVWATIQGVYQVGDTDSINKSTAWLPITGVTAGALFVLGFAIAFGAKHLSNGGKTKETVESGIILAVLGLMELLVTLGFYRYKENDDFAAHPADSAASALALEFWSRVMQLQAVVGFFALFIVTILVKIGGAKDESVKVPKVAPSSRGYVPAGY